MELKFLLKLEWHVTTDYVTIITEFKKLLNPGGSFVVSVFAFYTDNTSLKPAEVNPRPYLRSLFTRGNEKETRDSRLVKVSNILL